MLHSRLGSRSMTGAPSSTTASIALRSLARPSLTRPTIAVGAECGRHMDCSGSMSAATTTTDSGCCIGRHDGALPRQVLFAPVAQPPQRIYEGPTFYQDTSSKIGLPESEKNVRLRRKVAQKNRDSAGYFAPFRCFVGSPTAWTAMVNARVKAFAKHNLERECRDETRVNLSHHRRLPAASVDRGSLRHGTTRHHCRGELWARKCHHDARPCRCVARCSVQRTGTYRHLANRWEGGTGLCGVREIGRARRKCECRLPVRRCLLAGHDTGAVTRACPALGVGALFAS